MYLYNQNQVLPYKTIDRIGQAGSIGPGGRLTLVVIDERAEPIRVRCLRQVSAQPSGQEILD